MSLPRFPWWPVWGEPPLCEEDRERAASRLQAEADEYVRAWIAANQPLAEMGQAIEELKLDARREEMREIIREELEAFKADLLRLLRTDGGSVGA